MALNIVTLDDTSGGRVFALLAGPAGIGKTTQATTFPREETLIISLEKGLLSIKGSGFAAVEITTYTELINILEKEIKANTWIKHICIDSLSEIYDLINKEAKDKFKPSQNFAKFDDVKSKMFYSIRLAKQLDVNCFFICHTKEDKDGMALVEELAFDGKLPADLKKQFDLIIHMKMMPDANNVNQRVFVTCPELSKVAKKRVSPFMNIQVNDIEEPDLYKLTQKMLGQA